LALVLNFNKYNYRHCTVGLDFQCVAVQGPHLRTPNPGFNPGFTPHFCYIKGGVKSGLNPGFGGLRCGLRNLLLGSEEMMQDISERMSKAVLQCRS
jgi:hypothetical protein